MAKRLKGRPRVAKTDEKLVLASPSVHANFKIRSYASPIFSFISNFPSSLHRSTCFDLLHRRLTPHPNRIRRRDSIEEGVGTALRMRPLISHAPFKWPSRVCEIMDSFYCCPRDNALLCSDEARWTGFSLPLPSPMNAWP